MALVPCRIVWIGSLHPDTNEEEIRLACCQYVPNTSIVSIKKLEVTIVVIINNCTDCYFKLLRPKNCSFVNLTTIEEAQRVLAGLNGALIHGQSVRTNWGKEFPAAAPTMSPIPPMLPMQHVPVPMALPIIDPEQLKIIDKLAEFVVNKGNEGAMFENVVKERERHNSKFAFLFGGPYFTYYQHKLLELRAQLMLHHVTAPVGSIGHMPVHTVPPPVPEHTAELQHLLHEFSVSKQSSAVCAWLMSHSAALSASLELIGQQIDRAPDDEQALQYLYLISDLLQHSLKRRSLSDPHSLDDISQSVLAAMPALLTALTRHSTHLDSTVARIQRIFKQWESKAVFDGSALQSLERLLHEHKPPPPWATTTTTHSPVSVQPPPSPFLVPAPPQIDPNINMPPGIIVALHHHYRPAPYTPLNMALQPIPPMSAPDPNIPSVIEQFVQSL